MRANRTIRVLLPLLTGLLAVGAIAQGTPPGAAPAEPDARPATRSARRGDKPMILSAEEIIANEKGDGIWEIVGDVKIVQGDVTMNAERCEWNRNTDKAIFTQQVRIVDPNNVMTCNRCDMDFTAETATLTEQVTIRSKSDKKPEGQADNPDTDPYEYGEWTTTCDRVVYNYGNDTGRAEGHVVAKSEDQEYTVTAEVAYYEIDKDDVEIVTLPNNPKITRKGDDEWLVCEKVVIKTPPDGKARVIMTKPQGQIQPERERAPEQPSGEAGGSPGDQPGPSAPPGGGDQPGFEGTPAPGPDGGTPPPTPPQGGDS